MMECEKVSVAAVVKDKLSVFEGLGRCKCGTMCDAITLQNTVSRSSSSGTGATMADARSSGVR
jgi:hypothetical protein